MAQIDLLHVAFKIHTFLILEFKFQFFKHKHLISEKCPCILCRRIQSSLYRPLHLLMRQELGQVTRKSFEEWRKQQKMHFMSVLVVLQIMWKEKKTNKMVYASFCSAIVVQSAHIFKITISKMHLKRGLHKYAR